MAGKIRVGVIGTSRFAEKTHIAPLASHAGAQIVAVCGRNRARAEELAEKFAVPQVFTDWRALIAQSGADAIVVVTPDDLHYPITMAAIAAGKHVFCEKTLAMNEQQARQMYEAAEEKGLVHMTMFIMRWTPAVQYMRELMDQGYVGQVRQASFTWMCNFRLTSDYIWRADPQHSNGMVADLGSHLVDLARFTCGEISRVACRAYMYLEHTAADGSPLPPNNDSAACLLEFDNGAQAVMQLSSVAQQGSDVCEFSAEIHGSEGVLKINGGSPQEAVLSGARGYEEPVQLLPVPEQYHRSLMESSIGERLFIDSILSGSRPVPSFYEGWKAQAVVDALLEADRTRRWVDVTR